MAATRFRGRAKKVTSVRSRDFFLRRIRSKRSKKPLDSCRGTPRKWSDQNGTTAIRSAVPDFPWDHTPSFRGVLHRNVGETINRAMFAPDKEDMPLRVDMICV
jgi:hypothetical protein